MDRADVMFRAIDVALDLRKLLFIAVGLGITGLAVQLCGSLVGQGGSLAVLGLLLMVVVFWVGFTIVMAATARMCYTQLTGDATSWREGVNFAVERLSTAVFAPLVLVLSVFLAVIAELVLSFLGRIPLLGELLAAVAFVPLLLFNALLLVILLAGGWLIFPIVASDRVGAAGAVGEVVRLVRTAPIHVVLYWLLSAFLGGVVAAIVIVLTIISLVVTSSVVGVGLGMGKMLALLGSQGVLRPLDTALGGGLLGGSLFGAYGSPTLGLSRLLFALGIILLVAALYAIPLALQAATGCAAYLRLTGEGAPAPVAARIPAPAAPAPSMSVGGGLAAPTVAAMSAASEPATPRFCMRCGRPASAANRFCTGCGGAL